MLDTSVDRSEISDQLRAMVAMPAARERNEFLPLPPQTFLETRLSDLDVESLVLKYLQSAGSASGKVIAEQIGLPFAVISEFLQDLRQKKLVGYRSLAAMSDYEYELCEEGREKALRYTNACSFFGAAPVAFRDYVESVRRQSLQNTTIRIVELISAFDDLTLSPSVIGQLGQALNAGIGLLLYGDPGNGKSQIAKRVARALDQEIWIPRAITVTGEIIRLFDPSIHEQRPLSASGSRLMTSDFDRRWVRIRRPSVIVGSELTLEQLEVQLNPATGIAEAPIQVKSNGGVLVVDDFGQQRIDLTEFVNRWSAPVEKGYDHLTLPSGRKIEIPFDQLLVLATNLDLQSTLSEAFLRRIPYKVEVRNPNETEFCSLVNQEAEKMGFPANPDVVDYLVEKHYRSTGRPMRYCHAIDLLSQVKNFCEFQDRPLELSQRAFDVAVTNYFAGLS